jgi:broad specificity phosphatase PhoE
VSPKRRAIETAAPLAERLGIEPEVVPGFAEIDRSARHYIPVEEMRRENSPVWQALVAGRWDEIGYHDPKEFQREVVAAKDDLIRRLPDKRVVVVAHGGTINAIVSIIGLDRMFFFEAAYTSIRVVRGQRPAWCRRSAKPRLRSASRARPLPRSERHRRHEQPGHHAAHCASPHWSSRSPRSRPWPSVPTAASHAKASSST